MLVAISLFRRTAAIVVLKDLRVEYVRVRQLSSSTTQADRAVFALLNWVAEQFDIRTVAILQGEPGSRASKLETTVIANAQTRGIPIWPVKLRDLFESFAVPPVRSKPQMRKIMGIVYPELQQDDHHLLDAAATALYVQTERLLAAS